MAIAPEPIDPAALQWQDNGELDSQDVFQLVRRLKQFESGETSNELWRLGQKYPRPADRADHPRD